MRLAIAFVVLFCLGAAHTAFAASPRPFPPPGAPPFSFNCNPTYASNLAAQISTAINNALISNSSKEISKGGTNPYWSFTTPNACVNNPFGFGYLDGCYGGKTYSASVTESTVVKGILNAQVTLNLNQTDCESSSSSGTWSATISWPQVSSTSEVSWENGIYGYVGLELQTKLTNMVMNVGGGYSYTYNASELCLTSMTATSSSGSVQSVYAAAGITQSSGNSLTEVPKMESKISSSISSKGSTLYENVNKKLAKSVGKCKVSSVSPSPRPPRPSPSPRVGRLF